MNKSDSIKELSSALSKAQSQMPFAPMDSVNPFLKNKYADLGSIIKTAKPVLAANGLAVSQQVTSCDDRVGVSTIVMHSSGEWLESTVTLPLGEERGKSLAQVAGSVITYLRRYAYAAALGMYADEDTDGSHGEPKREPQRPPLVQAAVELGGVVSTMTIDTACAIQSSDGKLYGDIESEKLSYMANAIAKTIKDNGLAPEQLAERQLKLDGIKTILSWRNTTGEMRPVGGAA
jgi:hypothetical protein